MRSVENAECRKCRVWKMKSVENEECGKRGVWKTRSVENAECGKCGVLKKNILKGYKKVKRKKKGNIATRTQLYKV